MCEKYSQLLKPEAKDCPTHYVRAQLYLPLQTSPGLWETQSDCFRVYSFIPVDRLWTVRDTVWLLWGLYVYTRRPLLASERHSPTDLRFILVTSAARVVRDTVWLLWGLYVYFRRPLLDCERHSLTDLRFILVASAARAVRDTVWLLWGLYSWPLLPGLWETQSDWSEVYTRDLCCLGCERHSLTDLRFILVTSAAWAVRGTV